MTDQQLLLAAIRELTLIVAEHLEPNGRTTDETISRLIGVLDNEDLARAIERLEKGHGLRVVK